MPCRIPDDLLHAREIEAWKMRARGRSQTRIAEALGLTQGAVSRILRRVETRELKRLAESFPRMKVCQHHQLEHVVSEAFDAWDSSKTPRKRAASKRSMGEMSQGPDGKPRPAEPIDEVQTTEVIERDGDAGYLYCAMQGLRDIRALWGLDVAAAAQDLASSISQISADMQARGAAYESRTAEGPPPGDRPGAGGPDGGGDSAMQDGSEPVQRDDPLPGPVLE